MSTFNGVIHEFPDIRIDFFRGFDGRPPLACFLSHIHSDHLAGLDRLRSPFVYCSAATREILLRLEKYPCRLNYAKGIFEDPRMQTYKHLAKVLKPIPLDTPTEVELEPGKNIRVTLLDANHCAGAVMFLIEGNGKAVLYTGDIRSEPWWVNSIARNPSIIEYSSKLKTLDRIYLDTSMLDDFPLQTKAEGLCELLEKVARYPKDTHFFMQAWTYGYEEVWVALSKALNSKIHVDKYKMGVYKSLVTRSKDNRFAAQTHLIKEAPYLVGFTCGNNQREGCLTLDENVWIHSCEKGTACAVVEKKPIWIKPIVAHLNNGRDMIEVGIGGGGDDLAQNPSLETEDIIALIDIIDRNDQLLGEIGTEVKRTLKKALVASRDIEIDLDISEFTEKESITEVLKALVKKVNATRNPVEKLDENGQTSGLPKQIVFPYARHSSLPELRHFIQTFKLKDIWPCTVDPAQWMEKGITMRGLFGDLCTGDIFEHDMMMDQLQNQLRELQKKMRNEEDQPETQQTSAPPLSSPVIPPIDVPKPPTFANEASDPSRETIQPPVSLPQGNKRDYESFQNEQNTTVEYDSSIEGDSIFEDSQASALSDHAFETRLRAFKAAQANIIGEGPWNTIDLISTTNNHSTLDPEL
ncbi:Metallo-hydrolase/oxidoreductase [Rostrohypoxylon terebratum]|nr:Metallo-hydrolase/oxidoreductase [Rostrohypoxylon terebratum]